MEERGGFQGMMTQNKGAVSLLLEKTSYPDGDGTCGLGSGHPQPGFGLALNAIFVVSCRHLAGRKLML